MNFVVCSWILGSISESLYSNHACVELAYDIWCELNETYHKENGSIVFKIHQKIKSLIQSGSTVYEYYGKLNVLWKEFDRMVNMVECACQASAQFNNNSSLMKPMQFYLAWMIHSVRLKVIFCLLKHSLLLKLIFIYSLS